VRAGPREGARERLTTPRMPPSGGEPQGDTEADSPPIRPGLRPVRTVTTRTSRTRANMVRFSPGARTAWHHRAVGQTLHVVEGIALIGTRDGTVFKAHRGETVTCPPGEEHWHGATPDRFMQHLAMWEGPGDDRRRRPRGWRRSPTNSTAAPVAAATDPEVGLILALPPTYRASTTPARRGARIPRR
jgi:quercetin dioxygenase-like cupin family protein